MKEETDSWPCGLLRLSHDGRIIAVNRTLADGLGFVAEELVGKAMDLLLPVSSRIFYYTHVVPLLAVKGHAQEIYLPLKSRHGESLPMLVNATRCGDGEGSRIDCAVFLTTARARYEGELLAAKNAAESANRRNAVLIERLAALREDLRQSLAHTLHESLAQELSGLKWGLESARARAAATATDLSAELAGLVAMADATLERVRRLSYDLRPPELRQLGFRAAAQRRALALTAGTGVTVEMVGGEPMPPVGEDALIVLFRVVEEALSGILRQRRTARVTIEIGHDADSILLNIRDDGIGLPSDFPDEPGSLGMLEIAQRLASLGGHLALRTAPGEDYLLEARVPRAHRDPVRHGPQLTLAPLQVRSVPG